MTDPQPPSGSQQPTEPPKALDADGRTIIRGEPSEGDGDEDAAPAPFVERRFGRYVLRRLLGEGGMGIVYEAWDPEVGRAVALKQLKPGQAREADARARFLREARLAARLRHPGIVAVHDVGESQGAPYVTMDLVSGSGFAKRLRETRDAKRAADPAGHALLRDEIAVLADVAAAVAHAHREGVLHRDLKPANVVIESDGRARVTDFGLALEFARPAAPDGATPSARFTASGILVGTPAYMSPEQIDGGLAPIGPPADVWALGAILYEICTGRTPFEGAATMWDMLAAAATTDAPRARSRHPGVPAALDEICRCALEREAAARYPHAGAFEADLRAWMRGEPVAAGRRGLPARAVRWVRRRRGRVAAGAAAVLLLALAVVWGATAGARARERSKTALANIAAAVDGFEDAVMRTALTPDARGALARQPLDLLAELVRAEPSSGPAFAWRGRVLGMLGDADAARADLDRACEISPDEPIVWLLRGVWALDRWMDGRPLPVAMQEGERMRFAPARPETAAETGVREAALADLRRMRECPGGETAVGVERARLARALAGIGLGTPAGCEQAIAELEGVESPRGCRLRGTALFHSERFIEAIPWLEKTVAAWQEDVGARRLRAHARCAAAMAEESAGRDGRNEFRRAIAELDGLARRAPEDGETWSLLGNAQCALGEAEMRKGEDPATWFRLSIASFARALEVRESPYVRAAHATVLLHWATWEKDHGLDGEARLREAEADAEAALRAEPTNLPFLSLRGIVRLRRAQGDAKLGRDPSEALRGALADFDACCRAAPGTPVLRVDRASALRERAALERDPRPTLRAAIADLDAALAMDRPPAEARVSRAEMLADLAGAEARAGGDAEAAYRRAVEDLDTALDAGSEPVRILIARGETLRQWAVMRKSHGVDGRDLLRRALDDLSRGLTRVPRHSGLLTRRGSAYRDLADSEQRAGNPAEEPFRNAVADFDAALEIDGSELAARNNRGLAWLGLARAESAAGRDPQASLAHALADFEESVRLRPDLPVVRQNRGMAHEAIGTWRAKRGLGGEESLKRAEADFVAVLDMGGDPYVWFDLGIVYGAQGRLEESIAAYENAARSFPRDAEWARQRIAELRAAQARTAPSWRSDLAAGESRVGVGDYAGAREPLERALAGFEAESASWSPEERARRLADGGLAGAAYNLACILSVASTGRARPDAAPQAVAEEEAEALRGLALDRLEQAIGYGWSDRRHTEADGDLAPLRGDPRWAALLSRLK